MFKIVLLLSYFAFGMDQVGTLTITPKDVESQTCEDLLVSHEYTTTRDDMLQIISKQYKLQDMKILKEECTKEGDV